MKKELISAVILATEYHRTKKIRSGYPKLNIDSQTEPLEQSLKLIELLEKSQSDLDAFNLLTDRLTDPSLPWTDYSLNSYLIDELQNASKFKSSKLQGIDWNCFTPNALKTFKGGVYRGTSSEPEKVFNQGFQDYHPSSQIDDYLNPRNLNTGVSTSRSFSVAESYTRVISRMGKRRFVYTIIYLGEGGVDIIETAKARAMDLKSLKNTELTRAVNKDEINIIGLIPKEYIYCATEFLSNGQQKITYNPNFNENFHLKTPKMATHMPTTTLIQKVMVFFSTCLSQIKSFIWALKNRNSIDVFGQHYRNFEMGHTPQMKEAEFIFTQHQLKQKVNPETQPNFSFKMKQSSSTTFNSFTSFFFKNPSPLKLNPGLNLNNSFAY